MSTELTPEQLASLKRTLSAPAAKAALLVEASSDQIESFLKQIETLLSAGAHIGNNRLLFIYRSGAANGQPINDGLIANLIQNQRQIVTVGNDATMIEARSGEISLPVAAQESEQSATVCVLGSSGQLVVFAGGKAIAEIGSTTPQLQLRGNYQRSWRELSQCLNEHFEHRIDKESGLSYWADRDERTLVTGTRGTEKLFHHDLFWWCNHFVIDALDVYGEANSMGQDKTDITIVTSVGNIVIEVKWMGTNESNTRYAEIRIHEGMIQVADYLTRNSRLMKGYLVMYDARSETEHQNERNYPAACRHEKCEEPIIYFLRSETPSARAVRLARST